MAKATQTSWNELKEYLIRSEWNEILITLTLAALTLYAFVKRTYKYASVNDEVEAPIDYESDQYKEAETWFGGMGRC